MSDGLFRKEALAARDRQWLGTIDLVQPLSLWVFAAAAGLIALAVLLFLRLGDYTRRTTVAGQLVPDAGLLVVMAPTSGVVARVLPQEGDRVAEAAPLAEIAIPRVLASGGDAAKQLAAGFAQRAAGIAAERDSRAAQMRAQAQGLGRQLAAARGELERIEAEIETRGAQVRAAEQLLARYRALAADHFVSDLQVQQQQQALLDQVAGKQALERQAAGLRRNLAQLQQAQDELPAQRDALIAGTERELAQLAQERVQADLGSEMLIKAPGAGLIASRAIEPGQAVQAGQPLFSLLPDGARLQAQLWVPSRAIGFIAPGDTVLLRYPAFPYQKFGHQRGKVLRVSRSALVPSELTPLNGSSQASEPMYRVLVALDAQSILAYGQAEPLRPGMLVEADILGENRKLYEWVLEPLFSIKGFDG